MTNLDITKLITRIERVITNNSNSDFRSLEDRRKAVAILIGGSIAFNLPLPSEPVGNIKSYYATMASALVTEILSKINESYILEYDLADEAAFLIWLDRYKLVHRPHVNAVNLIKRVLDVAHETKNEHEVTIISQLEQSLQAIDYEEAEALNNLFVSIKNVKLTGE